MYLSAIYYVIWYKYKMGKVLRGILSRTYLSLLLKPISLSSAIVKMNRHAKPYTTGFIAIIHKAQYAFNPDNF